MVFYNGSAEEGRRNFKALLDLGSYLLIKRIISSTWLHTSGPVHDTTGEIPYERVNGMQVRMVYASGFILF